MSKDMTPQMMTAGQINKTVANFRGMLEKAAGDLPSDAVQVVLGSSNFVAAQFRLFRERVEACSSIIVRDFTVDLSVTGIDAIKTVNCANKYIDAAILATMPRAIVPSGKIFFFQNSSHSNTSFDEAEEGYSQRSLMPVDPHTLAAFNAANPEFIDTYNHSTLWRNAEGQPCAMGFSGYRGQRNVNVKLHGNNTYWVPRHWFAGVPK